MQQAMYWLLATLLFVLVGADPNCPSGYSNRDTVYCYKVSRTPKSKQNAATQCESEGGYLSSIHNGFDNSYLASLGQNASVPSMWLGIECFNGDKSTCVDDDGTLFGPYNNFYPGSPTPIGNCVYMSTKAPTTASWLSFDCDNMLPFVCEYAYGSQCQPGYALFQGSCYRVFTVGANEDTAELTCQKDCGHLVSIHSAQENDYVTTLAAKGAQNYQLVRIGLTAPSNSLNNFWTDDSPFNYSQIGYRNPDTGFCFGLSLVSGSVAKGQWTSADCNTNISFVCKTDSGSCQFPTVPTVPPTLIPYQCVSMQNFSGTGSIYSPGYPDTFTENGNCTYIVTANPGTIASVIVEELLVVSSYYIELYNSIVDAQPFAVIDSNVKSGSFYQSDQSQIVIRFSYTSASQGGRWKLNFQSANTVQPKCINGYVLFQGVCYAYVTREISQVSSSQICLQGGGTLAIIRNNQVNQFLISLTEQYNINRIWIGLTCPNTTSYGDTSTCVWDDGTKVTFNGFASGNPAAIGKWMGVYFCGGYWYSDSSSSTHPYICQIAPIVV